MNKKAELSKQPPKWAVIARTSMKDKKISFKEMGYELGLSESMVSRQLKGTRNVNMRQIRIYGKMLDMSLSELVGDDAVFVTDENQIRAVELIKEIPDDKKDLALKMLSTLLEDN